MVEILKEIFKENGIDENLDNLVRYAFKELETISKTNNGQNNGLSQTEQKTVRRVLEGSGLVDYFNHRVSNNDGSYNVDYCAELTIIGRKFYSDLIDTLDL